jgi:hypothetical protein
MFKNLVSILLVALIVKVCFAQGPDIAFTSSPLNLPSSGCMLSSNEMVRVILANRGETTSTSFTVSYQVNNGAVVTETVNLNSFITFNKDATWTHTFTTRADLSVPGEYSFNIWVSHLDDLNKSNDTIKNIIRNSFPLTEGGNIGGETSLCFEASGTLTLQNFVGSIQRWEISTNGGSQWTNINNTSSSHNFNELTTTTWYRVLVKSGTCAEQYSEVAILNIDQPTVAGAISGEGVVCHGDNSGNLVLSGNVGNVNYWEYSENGGVSWINIANTTNIQSYNNLTTSTLFRAEVQSGACLP